MDNTAFLHALIALARNRLDPHSRAVLGALETDPSGGGFLTTEAFSEKIVGSIYENTSGDILPRVYRETIESSANGCKLPGVDETSRGNSARWGGVVAAYSLEALDLAASQAKFKMTEFAFYKMFGLCFTTQELYNDVPRLENFLTRAFGDVMRAQLEEKIIVGSGVGEPLGIVNSTGTLSIARESEQTSGIIVEANVDKMWTAMPLTSRRRAVWLAGEGVLQESDLASYATSGAANPNDLPRLKGRPVIEHEAVPGAGAAGSLILADLSWYGIAERPLQSALSLHVHFVEDEAVWRSTWRHDGKPLISAPITGTDTVQRSPFVALAGD